MKLFLLATVLSCALGSPLLGSEKCTWGPSYWCSHVRHAKECGAMGHCMTTVWKNQIIHHQSTETCTFCQLLVNEVRNQLKNKATQDEVAHYFSRACNILPSANMKTECRDLVDSYMPEVLQLLQSELSADVICSALGFCTGLEDYVPRSIKSQSINQPSQPNSTCDDCKRFIGDIQSMITSNETQSELEELLTQTLCQWLGALEPLCQQVVEEYTPMILQFLASQVDPDVTCRMLGFCEQDLEAAFRLRLKLKEIFKQIPMKPVGGTEECEICKVMVQELQNLDRDEITQEKVKNFIETKLCTKLGSVSGFCQQYVEEYAPVVFMLLANELDPDTLCAIIGFCINQTVHKVIEAPLLTLARPISTTKLQSDSVKVDIFCPICHLAMVELDQMLGEKATKDEIKAAVDKVCDRLSTSDLQKQCEALIQQYEDAIIDFLVQELDPSKVCVYLHLCSSQLKNVGDDFNCQLCTAVIGAVEMVLKGKTEKDVEAELEKLCDLLGAYKAQCQTYIATYGSLVLNLLIQQTDPKILCSYISICSSKLQTQVDATIRKPINVLPIVYIPNDDNFTCELCTSVIDAMEKVLKGRKEEDVQVQVEKLCDLLGGYKKPCQDYITTYGSYVLNLLIQQTDSMLLCSLLRVCSTKLQTQVDAIIMKPNDVLPFVSIPKLFATILKPNQVLSIVPGAKDGNPIRVNSLECDACQQMLSLLEQFIKNVSEPDLMSELEKVCSVLPVSIRDTCVTDVNTYGPVIIDLLKQGGNAKVICQLIKLCSEGDSTLRLSSDQFIKPIEVLPALSKKASASPECILCEFVMKELQDYIRQNSTEAEIKKALENICTYLPATISQECKDFVDQYTDVIISLLQQEIDPDKICTAIGLCSSKLLRTSQPVKAYAGPECIICEFVMRELQKYIQQNSSEAQIKAVLENICTFLPATISQECKDFVDQYTDVIISLLQQEIDPDMICTKIGLCSSKLLRASQPVKASAGPECILCEFVMKELQKYIQQNSSEAQIKAVLENICTFLPATISQECKDFVDQYTDVIISLLQQEIDPDMICTKIGLCSSKLLRASQPVKASAGPECILCEFVMKELQKYIQQNSSEAQIKAVLENICTFLPATISQECKDFVDQYTDVIISLLQQEIDPDMICTKIGLCSSKLLRASQPVKASAGPECILCEFVMKELQKYIQQNSSEAQIKAVLENICTFLPATISQECKDFVDQYTDVIISLLQQEIDPDMICTKIGLCSSKLLRASQPVKASAGPECILCEFVMKELQKYIQQNSSEAQIKAVLENICTFLPATISQECKDFVDQYTDVIISLLQQEIDPDMICTKIGLCSSKLLRASQPVKASAGPECILCEFVMKELQKYIQQNSSEAQIKAVLENICTFLPATISQECKDFVDQYTDVIISLLQQEIDPDMICTKIGLCSSKLLRASQPVKASAGPECILCEFVMKELQKYIQQNSSEAQIKAVLENICTFLPATISQECKDFVDQYTDVIISLLQQEIDPDMICTKIGLCSSKLLRASQPVKASAGPECILCEFVMKELQKYIQQNSSEAEIKKALENICTFLPATISQECKDFVDQYTDVIISLLQQEIDPDMICTKIGLCSSKLLRASQPVKVGVSAVGCQICEFAMHELAQVLKQNATKEEIEHALENLCALLPSTVVTECDDLVKQYGPLIISLLQQFKPAQICTALGLCSGVKIQPSVNVPSFKATQKAQLKAGPTCIICEFFMTTLDELLKAKATQQEIENALEKVCSYLPSTISQECSGFVQDYGPAVISLLIQELDPSNVCTALKLCNSKVLAPLTAAVQILKDRKASPKAGDVECEACTALVTFVDNQLKENRTVQAIIHFLEEACALLPSQYTLQCQDIVKEYAPTIAELLALELDPATVCKEIGFCPASSKKNSNLSDPKGQEANKLFFKPRKQLLGRKQCTYGPSYWCASKENAIECKAVEHCQKHVWKFN